MQASTIEEFELGYRQLATRKVDILVVLEPEIAVMQATQDAAVRLGLRFSGSKLREPPYDHEQALAQALPDHRAVLIVPTSPFSFAIARGSPILPFAIG